MKVIVLLEGLDLLLLLWLRVYLQICLSIQLLGSHSFCHRISGYRELYLQFCLLLQLVHLQLCLQYIHLHFLLVLLIEMYPFHLKTWFSTRQASPERNVLQRAKRTAKRMGTRTSADEFRNEFRRPRCSADIEPFEDII